MPYCNCGPVTLPEVSGVRTARIFFEKDKKEIIKTRQPYRNLTQNHDLAGKARSDDTNAVFFADSEAEITGPAQNLGIDTGDLCNIGSVLNFSSVDEVRAIRDKHLAEDPNKNPGCS